MERRLCLLPPGKNTMEQKASLDSGPFPFSVLTLQLSENSCDNIGSLQSYISKLQFEMAGKMKAGK